MPVALYVQGDTNAMYTLHTNYIGSIEKISDKNGNVVDSMFYTPFGQRRLFSDWSKTDTAKHLIDRGFTGQQHLDNFALINFNGRMYDPVLAHFLSPDPYIQNPENPLNYNRYSYCLFSPLQYVDPTGFFVDWYRDSENNIRWTDFTSKRDFESSGIQGTYLGKTYLDLENNLYYSLFGQIVSANSKNGKITQKIDEAFINYANYLSESKNNNLNNNPFDAEWHDPIHNSTDFSKVLPFIHTFATTTENQHYPNEMGRYADKADIYFIVTGERMDGKFQEFNVFNQIGGNNGYFSITGKMLTIFNDKGRLTNHIVILNFKNMQNINDFKNRFYKLFPNIK